MASRYLEPEIERRSRAAMTRWQAGRLRGQVRHAAAHSPFSRRKFKAAGVKPGLIRSFDDLPRRVPRLDRIRSAIGFAPRLSLDQIIRSLIQEQRAS